MENGCAIVTLRKEGADEKYRPLFSQGDRCSIPLPISQGCGFHTVALFILTIWQETIGPIRTGHTEDNSKKISGAFTPPSQSAVSVDFRWISA